MGSLTGEKLSKVLLQLYCLVKHFVGLIVRLPLVHFPEKDGGCVVIFTLVNICTHLKLFKVNMLTHIRASMDFGFIKMAIG